MRICPRCNQPGEFHKNKTSKTGFQYDCKRCATKRQKRYYRRNRTRHLRYIVKKRTERKRAIYDYLLLHPCVDCGEDDPVVLEFDHVRGKKRQTISQMIANSSLETIMKEIKKCDVRCANCHRKRTAKQFKHRRRAWRLQTMGESARLAV